MSIFYVLGMLFVPKFLAIFTKREEEYTHKLGRAPSKQSVREPPLLQKHPITSERSADKQH